MHFQEVNLKFYLHFPAYTKDKNIIQQVNPSFDKNIAAWNQPLEHKRPRKVL